MGFRGIVENATDLPTDTATDGDMYYNKASSGETEDNKKGFYVFNGTAFDFIGATITMDFDKIFEIEDKQGDLTQLKTTAKDNLVDSINEIDNSLKNNNFVTLDTNQTITGLKTFDTLPQSSVTPANDTDLVTKSYVDTQIRVLEIPNTTNSIPLSISNQMATYDATTLQSVKWDFGNNTYSIFGTDETSFTTKTRTSGNLEKTADVIIGTAGAYAIPDDLLHYFGLSTKEMGQIPIGFSVTSNGNNIGGLGIGGATDALVLWGGKTTAGTRANCLSIQPGVISLIGQSPSGNASLEIAVGGMHFNSPNSLNFNLGNSGTLTMSPKMISELKRLLGIS